MKDKLLSFTVHGVPNLVNSKSKIARLIWFIFITISVGGCLYLISSSIIAFRNYDIITNIKVLFKSELDFPAVTFCPYELQDPKNLILLSMKFEETELNISNNIEKINIQSLDKNIGTCLSFNNKKLLSEKKNV